jgi:hypothetical protein
MKYLILRTFCDDRNAETPDNFILPLTPAVMHQLDVCTEMVKKIIVDTGFFPHPSITALEFNWNQGYWLITGTENGGFDPEVYFQVIDADPMAIVGEEIMGARMVVSNNGFITFKALHDETRSWVRSAPETTSYIFNIAVLRKAME